MIFLIKNIKAKTDKPGKRPWERGYDSKMILNLASYIHYYACDSENFTSQYVGYFRDTGNT